MVGGSIGRDGIESTTSGAQIVSATVAFVIPAKETMSPATASSIPVCCSPRNANILVQRNCSIRVPSRDNALTVSPAFKRPVSTRPVRIRPMKGSAPNVVASIENGSLTFSICFGLFTWLKIRENKASSPLRGPSSSTSAQPHPIYLSIAVHLARKQYCSNPFNQSTSPLFHTV